MTGTDTGRPLEGACAFGMGRLFCLCIGGGGLPIPGAFSGDIPGLGGCITPGEPVM